MKTRAEGAELVEPWPSGGEEPFRIGLFRVGGANWMGGLQYIVNLIRAIDAQAPEIRRSIRVCLISTVPGARSEFSHLEGSFDEYYELGAPPSARKQKLDRLRRMGLRPETRLVELLRSARIDFAYPFSPGLARLPMASATWIPDFQHLHLKSMFSRSERLARTRSFAVQAMLGQFVVLSSRDAASDFRRVFWPWANKARVLHFHTVAPDAWFQPNPERVLAKYGLSRRFLLVSNQFWQHKNHEVVFQAVKELASRGIRVEVACTGELSEYRNPEFADSIKRRLGSLGIGDQVRILGLIPRLDQVQMMRACIAVIQPSLFEGWSTVVEDARAVGKQIVLSDIPVHREQAESSIFFNPRDASELATILAGGWSAWDVGPDTDAEAEARAQQAARVRTFGSSFLALAREAVLGRAKSL